MGVFSRLESICSGIRQGGILSPFLFNIYVDSLISVLRSSDLGCHIGSTYIGCLAYANDFILLSGSVAKLQDMLKLSSAHAEDLHTSSADADKPMRRTYILIYIIYIYWNQGHQT